MNPNTEFTHLAPTPRPIKRPAQESGITGRPLSKCTVFKATMSDQGKDSRVIPFSAFDNIAYGAFYHDTPNGIAGPFTSRKQARAALKEYKATYGEHNNTATV